MHNKVLYSLFTYMLSCAATVGVAAAEEHQHASTENEISASISIRAIPVTFEHKTATTVQIHQGEVVQLIIDSSNKDALYHLHGYNLMAAPNSASQLTISFQADHTGRYPLVLHQVDPLLGPQEITVAYIEVKSH